MDDKIAQLQADVIRKLEYLAQPVDFDQLVADGVLRRKGSGYLVLDMDRLPKAASCQMRSMKQTKEGVVVRFAKTTKQAAKLLRKLKGE